MGAHPPEGGRCLALANGAGLILYLHGLFRDDGEVDTRDRLISRARAEGVSVLVVQGRRGLCDWGEMSDATCWPSGAHQSETLRAMVQDWRSGLDLIEAPGNRVLLGFSNGGFAAARVVARASLRRALAVDAYVIVAGGLQGDLHAMGPSTPALWLRVGRADTHQRASMQALSAALTEAGREHSFELREGGHQLTEADIAAAIAVARGASDGSPQDL